MFSLHSYYNFYLNTQGVPKNIKTKILMYMLQFC
jgi:hypothetical protein